jgi:hypothetical protein
MKVSKLLVLALVPLAACSSQPSKQDSLQVFAAATVAMSTAQANAVTSAQQAGVLRAPAVLTLNFTGTCALGGGVTVSGSYDTSGNAARAVFDTMTSFNDCKDALGTLDGSLRWTSTTDGTKFSATMSGELEWSSDGGKSASCDFDMTISVDATSVRYSGSMCGYDLEADLGIRPGA